MSRFQRLIRETTDLLGLIEDEHKALHVKYIAQVAENKRIKFAAADSGYEAAKELGKPDHRHDRMRDMLQAPLPIAEIQERFKGRQAQAFEDMLHTLPKKIGCIFDVTTWLWVVSFDVPYNLGQPT